MTVDEFIYLKSGELLELDDDTLVQFTDRLGTMLYFRRFGGMVEGREYVQFNIPEL